jgi:phycocyanobilin lyase beta subunit
MSGVNGGLAYDVDETQLPEDIRPLVQMIVRGPDSPVAFIEAMQRIADWLLVQQQERANGTNTAAPETLVPFLVDSLGYNNPVAARMAVDLLVRLYGKRAIPTLLQGVAALNYAVNAYALRAMGAIGDADAVFTVAKQCALRGPIPNVRRAAVRCLGLLHYDQAVSGESKRAEAIAVLSSLLEDPDWTIRYTIVWSLSTLARGSGSESNLMSLLARIADEDPDAVVRARAHRALSRSASTSSPASHHAH